MKKNVFGRKLKRDNKERKALFKSLMSSLVIHEKIVTTEAKAKAIRAEIDKLVTKAKSGKNSAKAVLEKSLSRPAFEKMLKEIGPRFAKRQGGYTRLIKLGKRFGDDAPVVVMEWTDAALVVAVQNIKEEKPKKKGASKTKKPVTKKITKSEKSGKPKKKTK